MRSRKSIEDRDTRVNGNPPASQSSAFELRCVQLSYVEELERLEVGKLTSDLCEQLELLYVAVECKTLKVRQLFPVEDIVELGRVLMILLKVAQIEFHVNQVASTAIDQLARSFPAKDFCAVVVALPGNYAKSAARSEESRPANSRTRNYAKGPTESQDERQAECQATIPDAPERVPIECLHSAPSVLVEYPLEVAADLFHLDALLDFQVVKDSVSALSFFVGLSATASFSEMGCSIGD